MRSSIPCRSPGPQARAHLSDILGCPPFPEGVIAQASQGQLALLSRGITLDLVHCIEDRELGGEWTLNTPWPAFPFSMTKVRIQGGAWVPSILGEPCILVSSECIILRVVSDGHLRDTSV